MTDSSSDNSHLSGSDRENPPQKPLGSISKVRRRTLIKNKKQQESEETATPTVETDKKIQETDIKCITVSSNIKKVLSLLAVILLLLCLLIILLRLFEIRNAGAKETTTLSMQCSKRFESALKKMEDQMEVFEQAATMVQSKLGFLDEKIKKMDSQYSLVQTQLNNLNLKVSAMTPGASDHLQTSSDDLHRMMSEQLVDVAKRVVEEELEKHEADGIGQKDYALASGGAFILRHSEPMFPIHEHKHHPVISEAINMISPSFGESGRCFSLKGSSGFVDIRLRTEIVPESVTLEHVSSRVAYNMSSTPKDCVVSAWFVPHNYLSSVHDQHMTDMIEVHKLVRFQYDLVKNKTRQTFEIERISNVSKDRIVNVVRFDFVSNYGADHTCIYRLRVHGHERNARMPKPSEIRISGTSKLVTKFVLLLVILLLLHLQMVL